MLKPHKYEDLDIHLGFVDISQDIYIEQEKTLDPWSERNVDI